MVLEIYKTDDGHVPGIEYLPYAGNASEVGTVLYVSGGVLQAAAPADAHEYIAMAGKAVDGILPVVHMNRDTVYTYKPAEGEMPAFGARGMITDNGFSETDGGAYKVVGILEDGILVRLV